MIKNIVKYQKGKSSWTTYIQRRVTKQNKNFLAVWSGETGAGKTLGAIKQSVNIDPDFDPKEQIAFGFRDVMKIINNFNNKDHVLYKKKYKIVIFDEPQIDLSNRDWQSKANKLFNFLLTTFRHQNIIMFFCLPYVDFLDSASVKLIHAEFKCNGWSQKMKKSSIRPVLLQYNSRQRKMYQHSLYVIKNGSANKLINLSIGECPKHLEDVYEIMKTDFTQRLNERIMKELEVFENDGEVDRDIWKGRKALTDKQLQVMKLLAEGNTATQVAGILVSSEANVSKHKVSAEKKGYRVGEFVTKKHRDAAMQRKIEEAKTNIN